MKDENKMQNGIEAIEAKMEQNRGINENRNN